MTRGNKYFKIGCAIFIGILFLTIENTGVLLALTFLWLAFVYVDWLEKQKDSDRVFGITLIAMGLFWFWMFYACPFQEEAKQFVSYDEETSLSTRTFMSDALDKNVKPYWTPYIFMGMPATMIAQAPNVLSYTTHINLRVTIVLAFIIFGISFLIKTKNEHLRAMKVCFWLYLLNVLIFVYTEKRLPLWFDLKDFLIIAQILLLWLAWYVCAKYE